MPRAGVHATSRQVRELNCSLDPTSWKLSIFSRYSPPGSDVLNAGDLVYLREPETRSHLRLLSRREREHVDAAAEQAAKAKRDAEAAARAAAEKRQPKNASPQNRRRMSTLKELEASGSFCARLCCVINSCISEARGEEG